MNTTNETTHAKAVSSTDLFDIFCDESYYSMWAVRRKTERRWGHCYHLPSRDEAVGLAVELSALTNLFNVSEAHDCESFDCDRRGDEHCDCLSNARKLVRDILSNAEVSGPVEENNK